MLRNVQTYAIFTVLIIIGIVFIAVTKSMYPRRFNDFVYVLGNSKYLKIYARDQKFFDKFDAFLFVNLIISLSIFVFICLQNLTVIEVPTMDVMFKLAFAIASLILIKVLIERLIGSLFEMDTLIDQYLFQKISYKNFLGVWLVPINLLLLFSFKPNSTIIYVVVFLLLIINIVGTITTIKTHLSLIKQNLFYFILYLCALEIAPYILLYKVFIS